MASYGIAPSYRFNSVPNAKRTLQPGSVEINWTIGSDNYLLQDNGDGTLTGHGTGTVSYATGLIFINPDPLPSPNDGDYSISYLEWNGTTTASDELMINPEGSTAYSAQTAMQAGSVSIRLQVRRITKRHSYIGGRTNDIHENEMVLITDD